jgi:predicted Zn-dependent protease
MSEIAWFRKLANSGAQWLHHTLLKNMKTTKTTLRRSLPLTVLMLAAFSVASYSSPDKKKPRAYRDINSVGHRVIGYQSGYGNWYSLEREKQIGAQLSAQYEKSTLLVHDGAIQAYLDRVAHTVSQNSDAQFPITTRVVDSEDSFAVTLAGGYQYISRGLLLQMENEGELAAVIARGIAHTSLRSATGLATRANLMKIMTVPLIFVGPDGATGNSTSDKDLSVPLTFLKFSRDDESAADYFGIQYLYKSGYSPECFISFIQKVWPPKAQPASKAFNSFPPLPERLEALRTEIQEILPTESTAVRNTESFTKFREHMFTLAPTPKLSPSKPTLLLPDPQKLN